MGGDPLFNLPNLLKVIDPEPIRVDSEACLAARHRQSGCRRCIEACPHAALALRDGKVTVSKGDCKRCGLCAAVCPTGAVSVHGIDDEALLSAPAAHCSAASADGPAMPCLGYLSVDHLLTMAAHHEVVELTHGDCSSCKHRAGGDLAQQAAALANEVMAAVGSTHTVRLSTLSGNASAGPGMSRRELFGLWRTESTQVARQFLPEKALNHAQLPARLPARRGRWLRQVSPDGLSEAVAMPAGPWQARVVSEDCTGCGICTAFCPTGALAVEAEGEGWRLMHQAAACVNCGTCVELCPVRAVGEGPLTVREMIGGAPRELVQLTALRCRTCRKAFKGRPGDAQCPHCRSLFSSLF